MRSWDCLWYVLSPPTSYVARVCAGHDLAPAVITFGGVVKGGSSGRMVLLSTVVTASDSKCAEDHRENSCVVTTVARVVFGGFRFVFDF